MPSGHSWYFGSPRMTESPEDEAKGNIALEPET